MRAGGELAARDAAAPREATQAAQSESLVAERERRWLALKDGACIEAIAAFIAEAPEGPFAEPFAEPARARLRALYRDGRTHLRRLG